MIDYVREACERLREQLPAGRQALTEKKQVLTDVKARLARYHERFERAANAGEEDVAWERIKELREQENALKAEIAGLESQQIPSSDRELDAVRARRYLRTLIRVPTSPRAFASESTTCGVLSQRVSTRD